ncbi:RICIN domain-containing protein [Micromonospora sp. NPDC003197]
MLLALVGVLTVGSLVVAVSLLGSSDDPKDGQSPNKMAVADQTTSPTAVASTIATSPSASASASATPKTTRTEGKPANSKSPTATAASARTGTLVNGGSGKCLTSGGRYVAVKIQSCNASANQQWELRQDGTLRSGGLCMSLSGGATGNLARVIVDKCDGTPDQQFRLNSTDDIYVQHAKECLDLYDKQAADATPIVLQSCVGTPNQSWYLK